MSNIRSKHFQRVSVSAVLLNELERAPTDTLRATHFPTMRPHRPTRRYRLVKMARWIVIWQSTNDRAPRWLNLLRYHRAWQTAWGSERLDNRRAQLRHPDGKINLGTPSPIAVGAASYLRSKIVSRRTMTAYRGGPTISTMGAKPGPNGSRS